MDGDSGKWLYDVAYHASQSDGGQAQRDSEFIAAAREAVPALLAEVARLREQIQSARNLCSRQCLTDPSEA
jgi:hypothetical protein